MAVDLGNSVLSKAQETLQILQDFLTLPPVLVLYHALLHAVVLLSAAALLQQLVNKVLLFL